jgi:hypothetical protein
MTPIHWFFYSPSPNIPQLAAGSFIRSEKL